MGKKAGLWSSRRNDALLLAKNVTVRQLATEGITEMYGPTWRLNFSAGRSNGTRKENDQPPKNFPWHHLSNKRNKQSFGIGASQYILTHISYLGLPTEQTALITYCCRVFSTMPRYICNCSLDTRWWEPYLFRSVYTDPLKRYQLSRQIGTKNLRILSLSRVTEVSGSLYVYWRYTWKHTEPTPTPPPPALPRRQLHLNILITMTLWKLV